MQADLTSDHMEGNTEDVGVRSSKKTEPVPTEATGRYPEGKKLSIILLSLALGTLLVAIDTTVVSVAIPKISTQFKALDDVGWYGSAYLITLTAFQPIMGNMFRNFPPKVVYMVSILVFEVGSTVCASAPTSRALIVGRAVAGVGAAGLLQGALGIITYISPLEKRPIYMAIIFSVFGVSTAAGPVLGGALTDRTSWRWCFWINVPTGGAVAALVLFFLRLDSADKADRQLPLRLKVRRMDPLGIVLLVGAVCCMFLALQFGGETYPWRSSRVIGLLIGFCFILSFFCVLQWRLGEDATIPLRFIRQRTVFWGSLFLFCDNISNYVKLYYLPFYFQAVRGTSATRSGVNYIPLALAELLAILISGGIITRLGYYVPVILIGGFTCAIGTGLLTTLDVNTSTAEWATFEVLAGIGLGLGINAPHSAIQAVFESDTDVFVANGVATFFSQLGGSIGVFVGEALLVNGLSSSIPDQTASVSPQAVISAGPLSLPELTSSPTILQALRQGYAKAITHIFIFATAIVCISVPLASGMEWLNLKKISKDREQGQDPQALVKNEKISNEEKDTENDDNVNKE